MAQLAAMPFWNFEDALQQMLLEMDFEAIIDGRDIVDAIWKAELEDFCAKEDIDESACLCGVMAEQWEIDAFEFWLTH